MLSIVRSVENRKPNDIGKSETSKIGRCLRMKLRMECGRTPAAHAFSLCRAHVQRPTLGLDWQPTKLSHRKSSKKYQDSDTLRPVWRPRHLPCRRPHQGIYPCGSPKLCPSAFSTAWIIAIHKPTAIRAAHVLHHRGPNWNNAPGL